MKRIRAILAIAAAISGLTACGDRSDNNAAIDQNNLQSADENNLSNGAQDMVPPAQDAGPQAQAEPQTANNRNSEAEEPRRPPPKAPPLEPEPDPHAGHDMNNFADMSHD